MNVCSHGAAALFVIGICRIAQRGWRNRMTGCCISFIFQWASCNYRCFSGMYFSHFSRNIFTCKCPLFPIVPLTATSNGMSYQRQDWAQHPISIFAYNHVFLSSFAYHSEPSAFPSPIPIHELSSSERQITQWAALLAVVSVQ